MILCLVLIVYGLKLFIMESKIKCEHPVIIFNHDIVYLMTVKHCVALYKGMSVQILSKRGLNLMPWHSLYSWKHDVSLDDVDDAHLFDEDGVRYPLFLVVPCGKCKLCKAQSRYDWQTRCMCESVTSKYKPLFITLTFSPDKRPDNMEVVKYEFQLFMKRLRSNVARQLNHPDQELRFLAVSEWTPKQHFPHIHMLLWNMPFVPGKGDKNPFWKLVDFIQNDCWQNGITKVEVARDPSGQYAMKYMTKEEGSDCWRLASRRPGIGYEFCMSLLPQVLANPDMSSFKVPDGKGHLVSRGFPAYFKRLLFPSLSLLFPAKVIRALKDYLEISRYMSFFYQVFGYDIHQKSLEVCHSLISNKYYQLHLNFVDADPPETFKKHILWYYHHIDANKFPLLSYTPMDEYYDNLPFQPSWYTDWFVTQVQRFTSPRYQDRTEVFKLDLREFLISSHLQLVALFRFLDQYDFDPEFVQDKLDYKQRRNECLLVLSKDFPKYDIEALLHQCDVNDAWEETHWTARSLD